MAEWKAINNLFAQRKDERLQSPNVPHVWTANSSDVDACLDAKQQKPTYTQMDALDAKQHAAMQADG
jgi:hypothetical protein